MKILKFVVPNLQNINQTFCEWIYIPICTSTQGTELYVGILLIFTYTLKIFFYNLAQKIIRTQNTLEN